MKCVKSQFGTTVHRKVPAGSRFSYGGCGVAQVMAIAPEIDLVPRRQPDLGEGRLDYHVYAGEQLVGRFYESSPGVCFRGLNPVMYDSTVDWPMKGHVASIEDAQPSMRRAFDVWLPWALRIAPGDPKFSRVDQDLRRVGAR
jgi:hypothetical protein